MAGGAGSFCVTLRSMKRCTGCGNRGELSSAALSMDMKLCWVCYRLNVSAVAEHEFQRKANGWDKMEEPAT